MAVPILLHGSEIWTLGQKDKKRQLTSIEMNFSEEQWDTHFLTHKRNEEILNEFKVEPFDEKLRRYKSNWLQHATRMNSNRMPKVMLNYGPN